MRNLIFLAALAVMVAAGAGDNWYVDAVSGKDGDAAYDGSSPEKAKKTLAAAMAIEDLASGDTVWAAEGDYNAGEMRQDDSAVLWSRVVVPDGVRLEASGRQAYTFITGRAASGDGVEYAARELGTNALRCVYLTGTARLRGFTLRDGHTCYKTDATSAAHAEIDYAFGAICGGSYVEDCTITNCYSYGKQVSGIRYVNCSFLGCRNLDTALHIASDGYFCNCFFDYNWGGRVTMYAIVMLNCTIGPHNANPSGNYIEEIDPYWGVSSSGYDYYNALLLNVGNGNGGYQRDCLNEIYVKGLTESAVHTVHGEEHVTFDYRKNMDLADDCSPASSTAEPVDYCTVNYFPGVYAAKFPDATKKWYEVTDLKGNPRISNGLVDAGCYEFDWRPVYSKDLAALRVTVTAASSNVTETAEKHVALGPGAEMSVQWEAPLAGENEYSFAALVTGTGTLKVYADGAAEPFATVTAAAGSTTVKTDKTGDLALRFVYEGTDGAAEVWNFQDSFYANISVSDKGIAVSGDLTAPGNYVLNEETTFMLTRTLDSTHLCTGFTTNHVFVSWDDIPSKTFTWTVRDKATSVSIEAVYAEHQTWYADAVNGSDANSGLVSTDAKKTLVAISTNGVIASGDTIVALPGVYDEGEMIVPGSTHTISNRVYIPAGVAFRSQGGASVTHIVGKASPNPTHADCKLGPGAVRCVYLGSEATIEGFTIREGHTGYSGDLSTIDYSYGAVAPTFKNYIVDCVISNCNASWRSISAPYAAIRTKFAECKGAHFDAGVNGGSYYNCYFGNIYGSYGVYSPDKLVNCTFASTHAGLRHVSPTGSDIYNCLILGTLSQCCIFHRCVIDKKYYATGGAQQYDADCLVLPREELLLDAADDNRPLAGSPAIDFGTNDYLSEIPEEYRTSAYPEGQRVFNGVVDAGAFEHDCRGELAQTLAPAIVTVTAASEYVSNEVESVAIPSGEEMTLTLANADLDTTRYSFHAEITGAGSLAGYVNGAETPAFTAKAADTLVTFDVAGRQPCTLRLVCTGDDTVARVRGFANLDAAIIVPSDGGLAVEGASLGTNVVAIGSTLTLTLRRAYDSTRLSTGFTVNGVWHSWDEHPDGWTHTVDGDDRSTTVTIGATYLAAGEQNWYVDAVNGDDANRGLAPENAKRTLAGACTNTAVSTGETIWLAPGLYTNGTVAVSGKKTLNRGVLPAGVNLASTSGSAADTIIRGAPTPEAERQPANGALGLNCVRCLSLLGDNVISNVTLCGGYAYAEKLDYASYSTDEKCGGAYMTGETSFFVGCVLSNNQAKIIANMNGAVCIRCRLSQNKAHWYDVSDGGSYYNCLVHDNTGSYALHEPSKVVSCTIGPNNGYDDIRAPNYAALVYNSLLRSSTFNTFQSAYFFRTYLVNLNVATNEVAEWADGSKTNADLTVGVALDANLAPIKGQCEAMEAANADYLALFPSDYKNEALVDFYGNPRILGGGMDIGAVEYDWRKDFANDLRLKNRFSISSVSSNVVETAEKGVRLWDAQSLAITPASAAVAQAGRRFRFAVTDGTLTVRVGGEVVQAFTASGEWIYQSAAPEAIEFSFAASADAGHADLSATTGHAGTILFLR